MTTKAKARWMLVHPCAQCGRPRALSLIGEQPACPACGERAVTPEVQREIDAARTAVMNLPLRDRQLHRSEELILNLDSASRALRWAWAVVAALLFIVAIVACIAWDASAWADPEQRPDAIEVVLVLPFIAHVVCGWIARRDVMRLAKSIRTELQARPTHDGKYVCRVCGGPIAPSTLDTPIVACPHCQSHNVLDHDAALGAADEEIVTFDAFEAKALANVGRSRPSTKTLRALLWAPLASAVVLAVGCHVVDRVLTKRFIPDPSIVGHAYKFGYSKDGKPNQCLTISNDGDSVPLQSLVGTPLYYGHFPYVLARVGRDGWGRVWLQSDDGRWSKPNDLCWPGLPE